MTFRGQDLFEEKSLWAIYKKSVTKLERSAFNKYSTAGLFILLLIGCFYSSTDYKKYAELIRSLSEIGLGFGSQVLGFLIAGFTIFATLTKPELFVKMYDTKHKKSGLNYLKHNFFAFVEVFVVYLCFLVVCLLIKILGNSGGIVSTFIETVNGSASFSWEFKKPIIVKLIFISFATFFYYIILALKSFIYNTYHTVITSIVWMLSASPVNDPDLVVQDKTVVIATESPPQSDDQSTS